MTSIGVLRQGRFEPSDDIAAARATAADHGVIWIDLLAGEDDDLRHIAQEWGWHPAVLDVVHRSRSRARTEHIADVAVVVLLPARYIDETESVEVSSLSIVVGDGVLVTVRGAEWVDPSAARPLLATHPALSSSARGVLWGICATVLAQYIPVCGGLEQDVDEIEEQLFDQDADVSRRIFALQRELIRLHHAVVPLPEMLDAVADGCRAAGEETLAARFASSSDAAEHTVLQVKGLRQTLDSALSVHATLVGEQNNIEMKRMTQFGITQNEQVKKISSWAAIGFAPSLVASVYGMNFRHMPELHWLFGYPLAIVLMVAVAGGLYAMFRKRGWL